MKRIRYLLIGFFGFLIVTGFNVSVTVLFYDQISYKEDYQIALLLIVVIIINALLCSIIDVFRRRIMIAKPLAEILDATKRMTSGDFSINLTINNPYSEFDELDIIKVNLNEMARELSKSEMLKNDFIANVSHEIKTPLAVIQNYAFALNNKNLTEEEKTKYLANLQESCKKLNNLVMNILKLNKLENQRLSKEITKFNLSELVIEQILQFEQIINDRAITLDCDIEEDIIINSEANYIELILNNLISNAIKFTKDTIKITLKKKQDSFIIAVKDNGCGMNEETGKHIFEKFYQGDTSRSKQGNGLGLALVKKVIDVLGGEINVESEVGKGSTFEITLREQRL